MPALLQWYQEDGILIAICIGKMAIEERTEVFEQVSAHLDAAAHPIHVILDWRFADSANLDGVASDTIQALTHRNIGQIAVVGLSPALHSWIDTFATVYGVRYFACDSVKDAGDYLESIGYDAKKCRRTA